MKKKKLLFLLPFAIISVLAFGQNSDPNAPVIDWGGGTRIEYGTVTKGDESNAGATFTFTNIGKSPLIISNCRASCGCVVPTCPTAAIQPGDQGNILVHYDVNRVGEFTKSITVTSNANIPQQSLLIHGIVIDSH
jgi:hypothetical protein